MTDVTRPFDSREYSTNKFTALNSETNIPSIDLDILLSTRWDSPGAGHCLSCGFSEVILLSAVVTDNININSHHNGKRQNSSTPCAHIRRNWVRGICHCQSCRRTTSQLHHHRPRSQPPKFHPRATWAHRIHPGGHHDCRRSPESSRTGKAGDCHPYRGTCPGSQRTVREKVGTRGVEDQCRGDQEYVGCGQGGWCQRVCLHEYLLCRDG